MAAGMIMMGVFAAICSTAIGVIGFELSWLQGFLLYTATGMLTFTLLLTRAMMNGDDQEHESANGSTSLAN